jgi:hypothetical protein
LNKDLQEHSKQVSELLSNQEVPPEMAKRMRQYMMDTQPKVKAPKRAFHASRLQYKDSILEKGLIAHKIYGDIYLCDTAEDCLKFVAKPCVVFEVDTKKLLPKRWRISLDHNKNFYDCEAYCYFGDIPVDAITKTEVYE